MTANQVYINNALDLEVLCIQLVEISKSEVGRAIRCEIQAYAITDCPLYTALSYTWGSPVPDQPEGPHRFIFSMMSSSSLARIYDFLEEMQRQTRWRYFWIDAIYINQPDTQERNQQVQLIRDIYSKVCCTCSPIQGYVY